MALRIRIERTDAPSSTGRRRAFTLAAATTVAVVLFSGLAYAFWNATGNGTANVGSVTAQGLTITPTSPGVVDLFPGKTDALTFTIANNNPYAVSITSITLTAFSSDNEGACSTLASAGNITLLSGPYTVALSVPAKGSAPGSIANFITMPTSAVNGCQTRIFTATLTATGQSV